MNQRKLCFGVFLLTIIGFHPILGLSQQVEDVPKAFAAISSEPEVIFVSNEIKVPLEGGHLQGVQFMEKNGIEKLLISGSSLTNAYVLQVDLTTRKTERLISLMSDPYRHAGGIQVSDPYLVVGIEDNHTKTNSKVCLYNYRDANLSIAKPTTTIEREGKEKRQTAGATGLVAKDNGYLMVVSNWNSRNWDFYSINPKKSEQKLQESFTAPDDWASYQSINLISDEEAIMPSDFTKKNFSRVQI